MRYNLGCGNDIKEGWVNVDIDPSAGADLQYDLEELPWPWKTNSADYILMDNVFEHLHPRSRTDVINECYRMLTKNGILCMKLPVPEIGGGWEETHYVVPSWRWPLNAKWIDLWSVKAIDVSKVGPGRILPDNLAKVLTRFWIARCVDEVVIEVSPR